MEADSSLKFSLDTYDWGQDSDRSSSLCRGLLISRAIPMPLNTQWFLNVNDAKKRADRWRVDYLGVWFLSSLNHQTPVSLFSRMWGYS